MKRLLGIIAFVIIVSIITVGLIFYARGYRPDLKNGRVKPTGIVSIRSTPDNAVVYIDNKQKGNTNIDVPDLKPGKYKIKIVKEGFSPWEKEVVVEKEAVNIIEAVMFPTAPSLKALTFIGVDVPVVSPDGKKIAFRVGAPEEKAGIWILNLSTSALPSFFSKDLINLIKDTKELKFSQSSYEFSPNSKQLLVKYGENSRYFLLDSTKENGSPKEVTLDIEKIFQEWDKKRSDKRESNLKALGKEGQDFAATYANIDFSPDRTKFIGYKPEGVAQIYDSDPEFTAKKEAKIFDLPEASRYIWYPDNRHIILINAGSISILDFDANFNLTIYTGDFDHNTVAPWPDGSQIVILTNLNKIASSLPNLYSIQLR